MKKLMVLAAGFLLGAFGMHEISFYVPNNWPLPSYDFSKNPLSDNKILLGRNLFYDPLLSKTNTISCESCHSPFSAFTHIDHPLSHGIHDSIGTRNAPALMNLAWQKYFMWDGAVDNLDMQALLPIEHPAEMGSTIGEVVTKLKASEKYKQLFYNAYGDSAATTDRTLKALSQFMLTFISAGAKYDKVMNKEATFTEQETKGYLLFKANCSSCHAEPLFTTGNFENNGLPIDGVLKDYGRMNITKNRLDSLKFKVPSLRNIEYSYPYMHDGRFKNLAAVLNHYSSNIVVSNTLAPQLKKGIALTSNQKADLISFLFTLSDKNFVFNPAYQYPK